MQKVWVSFLQYLDLQCAQRSDSLMSFHLLNSTVHKEIHAFLLLYKRDLVPDKKIVQDTAKPFRQVTVREGIKICNRG